MRFWLLTCCCQVTSAGCASAGSSSLPGALEPASRPRAKTHHLAPLAKSRPDPAEDSEKKENLATSSLALEQTVKIKSPMSPRENLAQLPSPRFSKSSSKPPLLTNKASPVQKHDGTSKNLNANGRVTKVRRSTEKLSNKQVITGAIVSGETELTKINRSLSIEKGESSTNKGVQILKQGPKRLKISSIKSDISSNKVNQEIIDGDGGTSIDSASASSIMNYKKIKKIISLPATKCEDQNIWSRVEETPTKPSWKSSLSRPSLKLSPRKQSAQANLAGPSSAGSSRLEAGGGSSKLVRHNRSSQLRATHLLPIKSSHKSITKKKSLDWEKKRGKSSFKNLPVNKKTTSTTCEDQLALENLHNKSKPKVKGELF